MALTNGSSKAGSVESPKVLPQGNYLRSCMTTLRNCETDHADFAAAFDNVSMQLIAAALDMVPQETVDVMTPTGSVHSGCTKVKDICGVSILRAGASFENALRRAYVDRLSFGMLLIQRDEATSLPTHMYSKLPKDISSKTVLILEPMLATGGSATKAIQVLEEAGVSQDNMVFVNLIASRTGLATLLGRFPRLKLVTAAIDEDMTASNHIAPGLGDFGDRFYGTT